MKRFFAVVIAVIGAGITGWAGLLMFGPNKGVMYGYDPVYGGLLGLGVFTLGLIAAQK